MHKQEKLGDDTEHEKSYDTRLQMCSRKHRRDKARCRNRSHWKFMESRSFSILRWTRFLQVPKLNSVDVYEWTRKGRWVIMYMWWLSHLYIIWYVMWCITGMTGYVRIHIYSQINEFLYKSLWVMLLTTVSFFLTMVLRQRERDKVREWMGKEK